MFSLSKTSGKEIAHGLSGDKIYLNESDPTDNKGEVFELLDEKKVRQLIGRRVNTIEINLLKKAIQIKQRPLQEHLAVAYDQLLTQYEHKNQREIILEDASLMLSTSKKRNRLFITGASGCGKSTFLCAYVKDFLKLNPNFKVILFSDVEPSEDRILGALEPIRVKVDMKLVDNPIEPHELANSVCIFDDIDSIQNKKVRIAVELLADSILMQGSTKSNIECIITRHSSNDYRSTKSAIQNCNYFVFFPQSKVGLNYTLAKFGMDKKNILRAMSLPTRWAILHTQHPQYILYQNGAYLI